MRWIPLLAVLLLAVPAGAQATRPARPERNVTNRGPAVPDNVTATRNIAYRAGGGPRQSLDLYVPADAKNPPLIVFVHGGGWQNGSKDRNPALQFTRHGYAVASINYRLSGDAVFPAQIEDCRAAIRFLRKNAGKYGYNGEKMGVWGTSAGGHLVALLGTGADVKALDGDNHDTDTSCAVQAVVDFFGPSDLIAIADFPSSIQHHDPGSPESRLLGGPPPQKKDLAALANPISHIGKKVPPFLIMHGDQDRVVPLNQSELLHAALKKAGADVEFEVVKGAGHGFGGPEISAKLLRFFDEKLKTP